MKNFFINSCIGYIRQNTNYEEIKIKEIEYGLLSIYLTISKMVIISIVALLLGIFKEMLIFSLLFNIIRIPAFGLHASKSWICLILSLIIFIVFPYISINIQISILLKIIICSLSIALMFKNAPADTEKRPIVRKRRRNAYKIISTMIAIITSFICVLSKNNFISNCLFFSLIIENILISPITYHLFGFNYNNYINFLKNHPEFTE